MTENNENTESFEIPDISSIKNETKKQAENVVEAAKKNPLSATKWVARKVVGYSVAGVVITFLHQNVTAVTKAQRVQLYVGAFVIADMVVDQAKSWSDLKIDKIADAIHSARVEVDEKKQSLEN